MTADQADWFTLITGLIADFEDRTEENAELLPLAKRLAALLDAHGMKAADFGRLLKLEPSLGSKLINGTRQLTAAHIRTLAAHFALPAEYFLYSSTALPAREAFTPLSRSRGGVS